MTYSTLEYLLDDYPKTLFPLSTTVVVLQNNKDAVSDYIYQKVLDSAETDHSFLSQTRCFASKHGLNLRRTVQLDPVAQYYIYDLVYRNRSSFRKDFVPARKSFGYRFEQGKPILPSSSYGDFRQAVLEAKSQYRCSLKFDVATYFNSLYHHDLVAWFSSGRSQEDVQAFGSSCVRSTWGARSTVFLKGFTPVRLLGQSFLNSLTPPTK